MTSPWHGGVWARCLCPLLTCLLLLTGGVRSSEMVEEALMEGEVVVVAENGTVEAVVLDCPYELPEEDLNGVVITWYHSRIVNPIYQWIPNESEPAALRILKDRVDLEYVVSEHELHRHQAIRILEPTTDLAGRYTCVVSSFTAERRYTQKLIVFSEPQGVKVWVEEREAGKVGVVCQVEEVFPQPVLYIYQKSSSDQSEALSGGTHVMSSSRGTYNMTMEKEVEENTLEGPTEFECHVTIPDTEVRVVSSTMYQPRVQVMTGAVTTGSSSMQQCSAVFITVLSLLLCLLYA